MEINSDFKDKIKAHFNSFISACKNVCSTKINVLFHKTLSKLSKNKDIKVCKFDKGTGAVILNTEEYISKLDSIVLDKSKFKEVIVKEGDKHPILAKESSVKYYLDTYLKPYIEKINFKTLVPSGSLPGKLYGLCKVHKEGFPLRPVISMIGSAEYMLAKYLDKLIQPHIPNTYMVNSTSAFLDKINEVTPSDSDVLVSFDVCSLFTNVPLDETINTMSKYLYPENNVSCMPFPVKSFKKLMKIATGGLFMFKDKFFTQTDGVAMGSPLGPTLANFFLADLETKMFEMFTGVKPKGYVRYVDDIFCIFEHQSQVTPFFEFLNNLHKNLTFTVELGGKTLPFLNTYIQIDGSDFTSCIYRKKTHTGVFMNFTAMAPNKWKCGLILCLLNTAKRVCSSEQFFNDEVSKLRKFFTQNAYPKFFFDKALQIFLNKQQAFQENINEKPEVIISIPFIGEASIKFSKQIVSLIKSHYKVDVLPVFTSSKVGDYFSLKCKTPFAFSSNVVYKFCCLRDEGCSYIGQTKRHLVTRVNEHVALNRNEPQSEIKNHIYKCSACHENKLDVGNFEILKRCKTPYETKIAEALLIRKFHPKLNKQLMTKGTSYLLKVF